MRGLGFDAATQPVRIDGTDADVVIDGGWNVDGRIVNGGYLQALVVRAAAEVLAPVGDSVAVSTSFLRPASPGPGRVEVALLRRGTRLIAAEARLIGGTEPVVRSLVTFAAGEYRAMPGEERPWQDEMPTVPGPDECVRIPVDSMPGPPGLGRLIDYAFVPADSGWLRGDHRAGPRIRTWVSFADGRPIDPLALTALPDIAPPVSFALGAPGWAPTVQMQVGVFAQPTGGPVLLDLRGDPYAGPVVAEDARIWDADGTLLAKGRQIALPPR